MNALIAEENPPNQALGNRLSPYKNFFNLQTLFLLENLFFTPGDTSLYGFSSNSLLRNAFLTSNCCKGHSQCAAIDMRMGVSNLAIDAKVSW